MVPVPNDRVRQGEGGMIPTKERARGRWRQILPALGIDARFLTGRNCPCPICGGKDRFRFIDRKDGDGMWLCSQCQPRPRPAIDLAVVYSGRPFRRRRASSMTFWVIASRRWFGAPRRTQQRISPAPRRAGTAATLCSR